jgi:hypothetical protein
MYKQLRTYINRNDLKKLDELCIKMSYDDFDDIYTSILKEYDRHMLNKIAKIYNSNKCKNLNMLMNNYEEYDKPFYEDTDSYKLLLDQKFLSIVPSCMLFIYGYLFNTNTKYKADILAALKKNIQREDSSRNKESSSWT